MFGYSIPAVERATEHNRTAGTIFLPAPTIQIMQIAFDVPVGLKNIIESRRVCRRSKPSISFDPLGITVHIRQSR